MLRNSPLWLLLICGAACQAPQSPPPPAAPERIFSDAPSAWVPPWPELRVSPNQKWAAFGRGRMLQMVNLETGLADERARDGDLEHVSDIVFAFPDAIARRGSNGWHLGSNFVPDLPPDAVVRWSPDGTQVAYHRTAEPGVLAVGPIESPRPYPVEGKILAVEWSHDTGWIFLLITDDGGRSSLARLALGSGSFETIAPDLDVPLRGNDVGVSPDGRKVYLALAGANPPDFIARHDPDADRDLDIFELDLATGEKTPRVQNPMDDLSPKVVGENLYWTRIVYQQSVVVLASSGGEARLVAAGGQVPYWSHDGRQIGYTAGLPRAADAPLNMDADVIDVDGDARPISEPRRIIKGYHEDFSPSWSPDGSWIAFHSHRSLTPVPTYSGEDVADDMYLIRPGNSTDQEIRITDFGWEMGNADWSPDGKRMVLTSWERGAPRIGIPWILTIDPSSGEAIHVERIGLSEPLRSARQAAWSPIAEEIAIENDEGNGRQSIWILELESRILKKVVDFESDTYSGLDWTPDGKTLVYSALSENRYQIFAVPSTGGKPEKLSQEEGQLMQPQVSPDGRWIAATWLQFTRELWRQKL